MSHVGGDSAHTAHMRQSVSAEHAAPADANAQSPSSENKYYQVTSVLSVPARATQQVRPFVQPLPTEQIPTTVQPKKAVLVHTERSGIVYDSRMMQHNTPTNEDHPEAPMRIAYIFHKLRENGYEALMARVPSRLAKLEEAKLVHDENMWHRYEQMCALSEEQLCSISRELDGQASLYLNSHSFFSARLSLGSVLELADAVASRRIRNGFAVVRPPGHHAEPDRGMGFCLFNNVAVAARLLLQRYKDGPNQVKRILILDWDVHHGNGTQRVFWDDAEVLYISIHRYENGTFYPAGPYGNYDQVGGEGALGTSINVPWPCAGMNDGDYMHAFQQVVMPAANEFAPDFVFISAGFDAAEGDKLGGCRVSPRGYAHMTHQLAALAGGRLAVVLEGGYTLEAIAKSAVAVTRVILGYAPNPLPAGLAPSTAAAMAVSQTVRAQAPYWNCFANTMVDAGPVVSGATPVSLAQVMHSARARNAKNMVPLPLNEQCALAPDAALASPTIMLPGPALVVFCHDAPALRMGDVPFVIEDAAVIASWAEQFSYALIDLEGDATLPLMPLRNNYLERVESGGDGSRRAALRKALLYIWDNYISLAVAPVVLIGHGSGCDAVMHLIANRAVRSRVRAVVQVMGHNALPLLPKNRLELRQWFVNNSIVICPKGHPRFANNDQENSGRRLGNPQEGFERDPDLLLRSNMDKISLFVETQLM